MKTSKKILSGMSAAVLTASLAACGTDETEQATLPEEPTGYECDDWEWDEETESYYCDDRRSPHFGSFFLLGALFNSKSALKKSSAYKTYRSNGGASSITPNKSNSGSKSGLGSGSRGGFGG
ncbi:hypothetical protein [Exiguobacterium sp. AM39-5BH]|uniref:hypothetical protein n=1 Tax=Exiguobacterium sp. AM39-5BH TaxID=2292355 RepID=UPI000FE2273E|nr:hypothetical protein [Exiguobacterium sp. AM39-5BH]RHB49414.1 hypothetical protein DW881_09400 [Exiguobacterium sp. AM39-5BH]